jgi:hypothetical protein
VVVDMCAVDCDSRIGRALARRLFVEIKQPACLGAPSRLD